MRPSLQLSALHFNADAVSVPLSLFEEPNTSVHISIKPTSIYRCERRTAILVAHIVIASRIRVKPRPDPLGHRTKPRQCFSRRCPRTQRRDREICIHCVNLVLHSPPVQNFLQTTSETIKFLRFTLPDRDDSPSVMPQSGSYAFVPRGILLEFRLPPVSTGLGCVSERTALVVMPETSVDEHNGTMLGKHNVGLAKQFFPRCLAKSVSQTVQD